MISTPQKPDCIIFAGDVACDGDMCVYIWFLEKMENLQIPYIYIPGNSDLRNDLYKDEIAKMASEVKNIVNYTVIIALNDCNRGISKNQLN